MNELFSWGVLGTFAGASIGTSIITQFVKGWLAKVPTQIVSYIIALILMVVATAAITGAADWTEWAIIPLNAIIVSLAANGEYAAVKRIAASSDSQE